MSGGETERVGPPWAVWVAWHLAATLVVVLGPSQLYFGRPIWVIPTQHELMAVVMGAAYMAAVVAMSVELARRGRPTLAGSAATVLAAFGLLFLALLVQPRDYSRGVVVLTLGVALVLAAVPAVVKIPRSLAAAASVVVLALLGWGGLTQERFDNRGLTERMLERIARPVRDDEMLSTLFYEIDVAYHRNYFGPDVAGGGIAALGDDYVVATGTGRLHVVSRSSGGDSLSVATLSTEVPTSREAYLEDLGENSAPTFFRVTDILVDEGDGGRTRLFAAHSYWDHGAACSVLRVSVIEWPTPSAVLDDGHAGWSTVYDAKPCRPFQSENQGGRLVMLASGDLLLSVGDHDYNGVQSDEMFAQDLESGYGKTILIDVASGEGEVYTAGHRNPQGLWAAPSGEIWSTEHGPRGGDELNRLVQGANYGWPLVTYGEAYFDLEWPFNQRPGSHDGFERPLHSWVGQSIGVSNLIGVVGAPFAMWRGDLLLASLWGESLWRLRVRDGATAYVERMEIGERIRDVIEDTAGRVVLWTDTRTLVVLEPAAEVSMDTPSVAAGRVLFGGCAGCHSVTGQASTGNGPDLRGIVGRPIASLPDYAYSDALRERGGVWTEERLLAFIGGPQDFAPGNAMATPGYPDPVGRASLVEYLRSLQ